MTTVSTNQPHAPEARNIPPHTNAVMRQTQATIGIVLLAGTAATYFVSTAFAIVPAIIGLGLCNAGITGICPMASLIGRLPWNRGPEARLRASKGCCTGKC